jgi:hypothetical protein
LAAGVPGAGRTRRNLEIARWRASEVDAELRRVIDIIRGIDGEGGEVLRVAGERTVEHGLVNEVNAEARRVFAGRMTDRISELILLLIPQDRKRRDGRDELIVAKRFETGNGLGSGAEGKGQSKS